MMDENEQTRASEPGDMRVVYQREGGQPGSRHDAKHSDGQAGNRSDEHINRASEESFPASDPPNYTAERA